MAGQVKSTRHSCGTRRPPASASVRNLAGDGHRESASGEARLKEAYGNIVIHPYLGLKTVLKSLHILKDVQNI